ncbi:YjiH family protein [Paraferrimonas sedimenticola]|uniref:Membrane protein n=1 Tax=Paraferrimonas sedimenticola TaxID=375674 RepID=A0AA37RVS3_9GAMM|nr:YjiH family protein [Paraferrimonas sedimenticola]GLP95762.1 membrane protein [Paraferrimonas sedimenticola]
MQTQSNPSKPFNIKLFLMFLLPSLVGVLLFMTPIAVGDGMTIPVAAMAGLIKSTLGDNIFSIILAVTWLTALLTILAKVIRPQMVEDSKFLSELLLVTPGWFITRVLGAVFATMAFYQFGPEQAWGEATGGLVFFDLLPTLFAVFILAGLLMPLLLNFGLLEFIGVMLTKVMRPLFNLPGRSAVSSIASWLGDGSVGILMTSKQYEDKIFTKREAAIIGTNFSLVSITFTLVIISQVRLEHMFAAFYLTVCIAGIVAAIIVPRLPPLRNIPNTYIDGTEPTQDVESIPAGKSLLGHGLDAAMGRAAKAPSALNLLKDGLKNAVEMVFAIVPVVMAVGTLATMVAEYTPIFNWLGAPFVPLLELMQVPEAVAASKTMVVGFTDMFVPSILAASIESDMTRFIVATLSVTQLIFMSEVGALLLGSKIPVTFWQLLVVFLLRTLVTLPVIVLMAHMLF